MKKNKKCHVSGPYVWHMTLLVPRGIAMSHVSVTIRFHCVDFDLVPIYVWIIQFSP